jgi:transposase InsO family protein
MDRAIEQWIKACCGCQLVSQHEKVEPMTRTELPSRPWEHLAVDFRGPLPSGDYIFAIVDYYSRWIDLAVMKSTTAEKMVDSLKQIFSTHGLPVSITTDNGPQFVSDHFKTYCEVNGIVHRKTTPSWPQANGEIERQNRSILKGLKIVQAEKKDWKSELQTYLMMYRSAPHTATGVSPAELLFNRVMRTKLPEIHKYSETDYVVRDRDAERKGQGKMYSDAKRGAAPSNIQPGDLALMKKNKENKLSTTFHSDPFKVVEKNGNSVVLESKEGVQYKRNVSHVKKFVNPKCLVKM